MIIRRLDVFVYEKDGRGYKVEPTPDPKWEEIEAAIRRLDRHCYPFVWLHTEEAAADDDVPFVSIMGGAGAYRMEGYPRGKEVVFYNEAGGDAEVDVWTSDQGYSAPEKEVCSDIEVVLRAAKYVYDTGDFDPEISWKVS